MKRLYLLIFVLSFVLGAHWVTNVRAPVVRTDDVSTTEVEFKSRSSVEVHLDELGDSFPSSFEIFDKDNNSLFLVEEGGFRIIENAATSTIWIYSGATGGYSFDGPINWASDGQGARVEMDMNMFNWPTVDDDRWALYGKEDSSSQPSYYVETMNSCVDLYDSDSVQGDNVCPRCIDLYSSPACPGTPGADQTSGQPDGYCDDYDVYGNCTVAATGAGMVQDQDSGSPDGYCDDYDLWGSCQPKQDREKISTSKSQLLEKTIYMKSKFLASSSTWMGAKCFGNVLNENNGEWCNDPATRIPVPEGFAVHIESITLTRTGTDIATTGGNEIEDCTLFLNLSDTNITDGGCNHPGSSSDSDCRDVIRGVALAHVGYTASPGADTWPRLNLLGERAFFDDFDRDGDTDDPDAVATGWWRLQVDHRHECLGGVNIGDACWDSNDCPSSSCTMHHAQPYLCLELNSITANVVYTLHDLRGVAP